MRIVKPKKLEKGDLIGVISPASMPDDATKIEAGVRYLEKQGYRVKVGSNVGKIHGYLAGTDEERLEDLHAMFKDKNVKAIFCVRGGYGTPRLLDKIDYKIIKSNPKIFVGYSDITALQMAFLQKAGLVTFAGPMVAVDFYNDVSEFTEEVFWAMITSDKKYGRINLPNEEKLFQLTKGNASGKIVGGNLAVFTGLVGSEYFPNLKDKILMLEEVGEVPYRIDRFFTQLKYAKAFDQIAGLIFGTFSECVDPDPTKRTLTLGEVIDDFMGHLKIPVVYNFKHGHIKDTVTVPFGIEVKMNSSRGFVDYMESAVI